MNQNFIDEINDYSIEDLELIKKTQQELYTDEEMHFICEILEKKKFENASKNIPVNEEMSQKAQYTYNQKIAEHQKSAILIDEICEAKLFAQAVELQLLKTPASAKFCDLEEMTVTPTGGTYIVSGYVDAQNTYGTPVRTPFQITVLKQNGIWKNADRFIDTSTKIAASIASHTILYWILGILGTIITFLIIKAII